MDESFAQKTETEITSNVAQIIDLFNLLTVEEKVVVKKLIREQKIF